MAETKYPGRELAGSAGGEEDTYCPNPSGGSGSGTHPAVAFLRLLGKDPAATFFRTIRPGSGANKIRKGADLLGFDPGGLLADNRAGQNVYMIVGRATGASGIDKHGKPTGAVIDTDVADCPCLFIEWDDRPKAEQLRAWEELGLPEPTAMIDSGGKSVHVYWRMAEPITPAQWTEATARLIAHCGSDRNCSNLSRLMRVPGFRYIDKTTGQPNGNTAELIQTSANRYTLEELMACLPDPQQQEPAAAPQRPLLRLVDLPPRPLEEVNAAAEFIPVRVGGQGTYESDRNALCGCSAALAEAGCADPDAAALELLGGKWPSRKDAEQCLASTTTRNAASFWAIAGANGYDLKHKRQQPLLPTAPGAPLPKLQVVEGGQSDDGPLLRAAPRLIPRGWNNDKRSPMAVGDLTTLLRQTMGDRLRFNELRGQAECNGHMIPEAELTSAFAMLSEHGYKISERNTTVAFVTVAREGSYHPVRQYLERIESDPSITPANISSLATDLLGNNNELANAMLRATVLGAVWRIFKPGSQFDSVCVLKGDQGLGKSKFWEHLAGEDWHTSSDAKDDKDQTLNIHSCWLYEMAELEAITGRKAAGELKNKITTRTDQFRAPYGRNTERHPRQSIFVGSVNDDRFLRDSTGSRRFWVVELHQAPDLARVLSERDAIWKAAVLAFRSGELPMLSPANQLLSNEQNGAYEQEDPWEPMLSAWAQSCRNPFTSSEALTGSGCRAKDQISRQDEMRAAEALKRLGFVQDKNALSVHGVRARRWKSTQPAQPDTTSKREVVSGQNPYTAVDQPPLAQPSQPISESRDVVGEGGGSPATEEHAGDVFRQEVVSDKSEPQIPCSAKSFADTPPHLPRLCQALSTVGLDTDPEPSPPWHQVALGIHAEHPDWHPHQIALHLRQGFERINGRDVKALLGARP